MAQEPTQGASRLCDYTVTVYQHSIRVRLDSTQATLLFLQ